MTEGSGGSASDDPTGPDDDSGRAGATPDPQRVIDRTRCWLERAVIGLDLCPFAGAVHRKGRIRYVVSAVTEPARLLEELAAELQLLQAADPSEVETTLLIHPGVLTDFLDYNDFLDVVDEAVSELGLEGELQVASFHPEYQFAGTSPDDIGNATNRSPYPTLHLLRESSISRAVDAYEGIEEIGERNAETLRRLGADGWARLWQDSPQD
ncbi:MAG TPA: DUF1415 domain-containing protein [Gaiellaceae bacterium]|nr:DUF1415 domain-containing protein [Gaiellaceae bacterium]